MYTAGSLFSGIGGLDLAASLAGFDIQFHVEIDEFCRKVLSKHASRYWPNAATFTDVRTIGKHNLPRVDCLFGGFPCQDISVAGKQVGFAGSRSSLWYEFKRIIGEIRPNVVLLENVPGIYSRPKKTCKRFPANGTIGITSARTIKISSAPPPLFQVIVDLAEMGYVGRYGTLRASDSGAPHQRERWFLVAYAAYTSNTSTFDKKRWQPSQPGRSDSRSRSGDVVNASSTGREKRNITTFANRSRHTTRRLNEARANRLHQSRMGRNHDGLPSGMDFPGWPARPGEDQHAYEPSRVTSAKTPDRAARLKALGNAVVPQVAYPLFASIHEWLTAQDAELVA